MSVTGRAPQGDGSAPVEASVSVREFVEGDWPAVYPFFAAIVADGETYAYPEHLDQAGARALWEPGAPGRIFVAERAGAVVGTAISGPNRPGRGSHVATASFMVDPAAHGGGVGRALGEAVLAWATDAGFTAMQFNAVVETNLGAVALWRSLGFEILGTVPGAFHSRRHGPVGLHVMWRRLGAGPPGRPATGPAPSPAGA
jgi:GNAT superfamily N-acetyltransferase